MPTQTNPPAASQPLALERYISPHGRDDWSGLIPEPNHDRTDGPLASLPGAQRLIRQLKAQAGGKLPAPLTFWLRGGRDPVSEPVIFTPQDSGPVTFAAYQDEIPIIDGGIPVTGWQEEIIRGQKVWAVSTKTLNLPPDAAAFRQLFVDGQRRNPPRAPKEGLFTMQSVPGLPMSAQWGTGPRQQDSFIARPGMFGRLHNLTDVEVVVLHWWIEERFPVVSYDPQTRLVKLGRTSRGPLVDDQGKTYARYYLNNVFEEFNQPGQWYLDQSAAKLYYIPLPGELPEKTQVTVPRTLQLLQLRGNPETNQWVEGLTFRNLTFAHTDWRHPQHDPPRKETTENTSSPPQRPSPYAWFMRGHDAAASQAACDVPGVIYLEGARRCTFEDCTVRNTGWYAIELADGCINNRVVGCTLRDLGAGGIKITGSDAAGPRVYRTGDNRITDNEITQAGRIFHSAVGILAMHTFGNTISHNHIHDLYYTAISVGWVWGYAESVARDNRIEKNHLHQIGQGMLSDMGGIYTLGVQPGTVIRGNLIHDVTKLNYGGWCIYPDEGSSHILIENNICYDTNGEIFHQHYGRENIVRNNIFAFGGHAVIAHSRADNHLGFTLERNILVTAGQPIFTAGYRNELALRNHIADLNLLWDTAANPLSFVDAKNKLDFQAWQALSQDTHSLVANPLFRDLNARDFTLAPNSPALPLGFVPIDISDVGPRPKDKRE
ncbi:MAG: right-handed parallel beta-helix repeat-containing protein [Phycisphaeraceae bacterium]|nr:right-handed parallel beta-helix repeat-containing protein [Phycisphaeraceae bacterium]